MRSLPWWLAVWAVVNWFGFAAIFLFQKRPAEDGQAAAPAPAKRRDRQATLGIWIVAMSFAVMWFGPPIPHFVRVASPAVQVAIAIFSAVLAPLSGLLVFFSVRTLGRQWAVRARLIEGHQLITEGPYRFVRNPIYLGMLGMLVATGLAFGRALQTLAAAVIFLIGTAIRIQSEEKLLQAEFGKQFEDYSSRVRALIPGVF
jgi:protein-S-isoprenylcysteine O-methyltransferase Ste14